MKIVAFLFDRCNTMYYFCSMIINQTKQTMKKATMATVKSFVKKNRETLLINLKSSFDGMIDGLSYINDGFVKAEIENREGRAFTSNDLPKNTLGIRGAWFVGGSRDYITPFQEGNLIGFEIYNSCGHFYLAINSINQ